MPDPPAPTQARKRVLLIEDEAAIRTVVGEILRRDGYEVIEAAAGQAGIRTAVSREPDIILLDWVLPDISGLDVCREIRRQGVLCPVLMLTGRSSKVDMVVGLEVGADDYITKPFDARELTARVRAVLPPLSPQGTCISLRVPPRRRPQARRRSPKRCTKS